MRWMDRMLSLFSSHKPDAEGERRLDALVADTVNVGAEAVGVSKGLKDAADTHKNRLSRVRKVIAYRVIKEARARPKLPTSDMRAQVDAVIHRFEDRREPGGH